jgi:hypothetical protein
VENRLRSSGADNRTLCLHHMPVFYGSSAQRGTPAVLTAIHCGYTSLRCYKCTDRRRKRHNTTRLRDQCMCSESSHHPDVSCGMTNILHFPKQRISYIFIGCILFSVPDICRNYVNPQHNKCTPTFYVTMDILHFEI